MKYKSIAIVCLLLAAQLSFSQKIKYKDLFPQLNSKNYAEAGPKLVIYLSDPKNQDEANPNLQMGLMLEDRFLKYDVVNDSSKVYATGDSAITYLDLAKSLITEKELKKNDEYYQSFFRRDLRTGEFGIKVSDVHLDIEKKIESIQNRASAVKSMHRKIDAVAINHKLAMDAYRQLTDKFSSYNEMLLSVNDEDLALIGDVETKGGLASDEAQAIGEMAKKLGSDKYQDEVELKSIANFGEDGLSESDIKGGSISLWDFETWGRDATSEIRGGVGLFKTMITNYSNELREKKKKLKKSTNAEIGAFPDDLATQFQKYDPESAIEKLLRVEMHEARVIKQVDLQINPALLDSSKIASQLLIYQGAKADVDTLNMIVETINSEDLTAAKTKYKDYIESFFATHGTASKYVQDMVNWSRTNKEWIGNSVAFWEEKNKWGIIEKEGEEERVVPLFAQDTPENEFQTLGVLSASIEEVIIYGADFGQGKGYLGSFGENRKEQWKHEFDLPGTEAFQYDYDTIPSLKGSTSFYVYNQNAQENNLSVVSYNSSGQLNWAVNVTISKAPVDFKFDNLTQELTILLYPEEDLPLDSDELGYVVIDRTGNAR